MIKKIAVPTVFLLLLSRLGSVLLRSRRKKLYITIADDGLVKIGTCKHCVVHEKERPARAWPATNDCELDFPRDRLLQRLADYGLQVAIEQEYVCP